LLLAVQINYKLEWSFVKTALKWHVDFGIGLSFVAMFHLLWHLSYYLRIFKPSNNSDQIPNIERQQNPQKLRPLIFLSGFISMVVQILMIREITTVFEGNELMMGWMLGTWMLLTGIGAFMGRQNRIHQNAEKLLKSSLFLLSLLPIIIVFIINIIKNQLFPIGMMISPTHFLILLFVALSPICLLMGIVYSLLVELYRKSENGFIKVYAFESIGSLIGGLVVSFLFIQWLTVLQSLFLLSLISLIFLFYAVRDKIYLITGFLMLILLILFFIFPIDNGIKSFLFTNQKVLESKETFYGNITITESAGQYNFFGNGSLLFTTDNTILNEENVHFAMLQRNKPEKVLIVSGGISGMVDEILKYPSVTNVDYVEINPSLVSIANKYKPLPLNSKLHYTPIDGRRYIQQVDKKFDVAIFAIPSPSSLQINRFYTDEFLRILKGKLSQNAIIIFGLAPAGNYISPIKASIEASIYQTLRKDFKNVEIIPGEKDYLLASDSSISVKISQSYANKGVENKYVKPYYLDDFSIQQRSEQIKNSIEGINLINTDSKPIPVFYETLQFISQFRGSNWVLFAIPILLLILPLLFMRSIPKGMYITGFSASSIEILLIFSFQIIYGYVYSAIGLIIAVFMGGLAVGSLLGYKIRMTRKHFIASQATLGIYALIFPLLWYFQRDLVYNIPVLIVFFIMIFIPSVIVGFQYVAGTMLLPEGTVKAASTLYSADLIGSALGVAATTVILLPLLGLTGCCFIIAGFNFIGIGLTLLGEKSII
jgi:spermidine synthase